MSDYDQVPYINSPYAQTHPGRLFVMARLAGLDPPAVETCRVLELGASEGENLVGMAMVLPSAEFVGIELAEAPVVRGQKTISDLGLNNVQLHRMNLLDLDEGLGKFDYIIAHGLYSWTPPVVRDKILAVAHDRLTPQGVAFVSYNTQPGGHLRRMLREMMLFHIGAADENPAVRLEKGRELLRLMARRTPTDAIDGAVTARVEELLEKTDSSLFHDDLADCYEPVHFHEFMTHAAKHGLQYLGEASLRDSMALDVAPDVMASVREMAAGDRIVEQQYLDFVRTRQFRRTLLCKAENTLSEGGCEGCYAATSTKELEPGVFVNAAGEKMRTEHPTAVGYLRRLMKTWPLSERVAAEDAGLALELYKVSMIELHGFAGSARRAGARPRISRFARYQTSRGDSHVTTLWHRTVALGDAEAKRMIGLMDGSRDRDKLARTMGCSREMLDGAVATLEREGMFE
jgi:SAM-dependent methyltransferase